jgi:hypothetical protein
MPPACLRTAETPLHAAPLVSASYGAPFTRLHQPRIAAHCTFSAETAHDLAPGCVGSFGTPRLGRFHSRAEAHPTRGASGSSIPSTPKVHRPRFRHRRPAPFGWAVPAQQNSHNSSNISVFVKSPLQSFPRRAEAVREPTARPDVVKSFRRPFPPTVAPRQ